LGCSFSVQSQAEIDLTREERHTENFISKRASNKEHKETRNTRVLKRQVDELMTQLGKVIGMTQWIDYKGGRIPSRFHSIFQKT
jgi:hypothetical protein